MTPTPEKVAVLGGGLGSLITLAGIVGAPEWNNQYQFTVYEKSWRLGGKGASGRAPVNPDGSWGEGSRILEHGLHIWMGFYNNAFHYIQEAFTALGEDWTDFYTPQDLLVFQEELTKTTAEGEQETYFEPWPIMFPTNTGVPGTPSLFGFQKTPEGEQPKVTQLMQALIPFVRMMTEGHNAIKAFDQMLIDGLEEINGLQRLALSGLEELFGFHLNQGIGHWLDGIQKELIKALEGELQEKWWEDLVEIIDFFQEVLQVVQRIFNLDKDSTLRHMFIIIDIALGTLKGMLQDEVLSKGLDSINNIDWTDWLRKHGVTELSLHSAPMKSLYDLVFGYAEGDINKPSFSAGVSLYCVARIILTYKGHIMWKMNMGMGDTIFTTLEKYLQTKGVRFEYFQEVRDICLSEDGGSISKIKLCQTVNLKNPTTSYDPYVILPYSKSRSGTWPCWPEQPLWEQIDPEQAAYYQDQSAKNGTSLESPWLKLPNSVKEYELVSGTDFDQVICGITLRALVPVTPSLQEKKPKWATMLDQLQTVTTQAYQLWFKKTAQETGFNPGDPKYDHTEALTGGYARPWGTQADMSYLLPEESWTHLDPKYLVYSCCPMPMPKVPVPITDHSYPKRRTEEVKALGWDWLNQFAGYLWPNCTDPQQPRGLNPAELDSQYWRAGTNYTEHYVLSLPNSTQYRLLSEDLEIENFFIAGDWTRNVINAGCVESATISGLFCARQFSGWDIPIYNVDPSKGGWTGT